MEYCNDSSAVETLFQCTQHLLGRYVQFPDQSRRESMPLYLYASKNSEITKGTQYRSRPYTVCSFLKLHTGVYVVVYTYILISGMNLTSFPSWSHTLRLTNPINIPKMQITPQVERKKL